MNRTNEHTISVHPGQVLFDELEDRGITASGLAAHIGVTGRSISEIGRGKRGISAELAVKLSRALGSSAAFWLNLQKNWELSLVDQQAVRCIKHFAA